MTIKAELNKEKSTNWKDRIRKAYLIGGISSVDIGIYDLGYNAAHQGSLFATHLIIEKYR